MIHPIFNMGQDLSTASNEVIMKFRSEIDPQKIKEYHRTMDAIVVEENAFLGFQVVSSDRPIEEMMAYYQQLEGTEYVRTNAIAHIM